MWDLLSQDYQDSTLKVQTLYNFLCYLLSLGQAVELPADLEKKGRVKVIKNKYGVIYNGVFFLNPFITRDSQKAQQNKLIKEYYTLLNNKKMFDRDNYKQSKA